MEADNESQKSGFTEIWPGWGSRCYEDYPKLGMNTITPETPR